jgi:hypothetical protein
LVADVSVREDRDEIVEVGVLEQACGVRLNRAGDNGAWRRTDSAARMFEECLSFVIVAVFAIIGTLFLAVP